MATNMEASIFNMHVCVYLCMHVCVCMHGTPPNMPIPTPTPIQPPTTPWTSGIRKNSVTKYFNSI